MYSINLIFQCQIACNIVEEEVLTVEELLNLKLTSQIDTDPIAERFVQKYFSPSVRSNIKQHLRDNPQTQNWTRAMECKIFPVFEICDPIQ